MSIGSMLAIPVVPYVADILGRRAGVVVGCVIMLGGVAMVSIGYRVALVTLHCNSILALLAGMTLTSVTPQPQQNAELAHFCMKSL